MDTGPQVYSHSPDIPRFPRYTHTHRQTVTYVCPLKSGASIECFDTNLNGSSGQMLALVPQTQMALLTHSLRLCCFCLDCGKI